MRPTLMYENECWQITKVEAQKDDGDIDENDQVVT